MNVHRKEQRLCLFSRIVQRFDSQLQKFESKTESPLGILPEISSFIEVYKINSMHIHMLSLNVWLHYTDFSDFANFLIPFKVFVSIFFF